MCGICGFNWEDKALVKKMAKAIAHRGPDSEGYYVNKISLGHKRLKIIDLSAKASQPMHNKNQTTWIVYNGEVYNFKEIRKKLEKKGYKFKSASDTEVVLYAYQAWGAKCLEMFNGMFAFCIYDLKKKKLILARDRIGIKPLYYYYNKKKKKFIFASEIKAILQHKIKRQANKRAIVDYLTFQNIMDDKTFFSGIRLLLPGKYMVFDLKKQKLEIKTFWDIDFKKPRKSRPPADYLRSFRKIFKDSVERHMISDVPVGAYASGGFDSGSVSVMASKLMHAKSTKKNKSPPKKKRLNMFTAKFREKGFYDETPCSRALAKRYNAKMHEINVTPKDFLAGINRFIYHLDEPRAGLPAIAAFFVAKKAAEKVTVVLTGHGGDELFAGYPVYKSFYLKSLLGKNIFNVFKAPGLFELSEIPRAAYYLFFPFFQRETRHGFFIIFDEYKRKRLFHSEFYKEIKRYAPAETEERYYKKTQDSVQNLQALYLKAYLPSMLIVEDKVSMAHSIEGRIPFCDNELVDFSLSTPLEIKLHNKTLKYIVKQGMKDMLPNIYYKQPKKGFPTPLSLWLRKELKQYAYNLLLGKRAVSRKVFNPEYVKALLDTHCARKTDTLLDLVNAARIWCLINVELWFRIFIDQDKEILKQVR
ncbi:asparagine synthase (glutamine-hydrolyzing) [Candidatus Woesearchaeota archaeon]|nr:asparagine synthase (glutamine-hydrolyzing) [Candidatus Woesearchaeota archaeon]